MNKLRVEVKESNYDENIFENILSRTRHSFNKNLFLEVKNYILNINNLIKKLYDIRQYKYYKFNLSFENSNSYVLKTGDKSELGRLIDSINFEYEKKSYTMMGTVFKAGYGGISKTQKLE